MIKKTMARNSVTNGDFQLPATSECVAKKLFTVVDSLNIMDSFKSYIDSPRHDASAENMKSAFVLENKVISIETLDDLVEFQFDFHSAVDKQLEFAFRMTEYSWHRLKILDRLPEQKWTFSINRYVNFMAMKKFWPLISLTGSLRCGQMVPAEDIDLVWRSHLLLPKQYQRFSQQLSQETSVHISSLPKIVVDKDEMITAIVYQHIFGRRYTLCLCWYCIVGREGHRIFGRTLGSKDLDLDL